MRASLGKLLAMPSIGVWFAFRYVKKSASRFTLTALVEGDVVPAETRLGAGRLAVVLVVPELLLQAVTPTAAIPRRHQCGYP